MNFKCNASLKFAELVTVQTIKHGGCEEEKMSSLKRMAIGFLEMFMMDSKSLEKGLNSIVTATMGSGSMMDQAGPDGRDNRPPISNDEPSQDDIKTIVMQIVWSQIPIIIFAILPLLLLTFAFCCCCCCCCSPCCGNKDKKRTLVKSAIALFIGITMVSVAWHSLRVSNSINRTLSNLPEKFASSTNVLKQIPNVTMQQLNNLTLNDMDRVQKQANDRLKDKTCFLDFSVGKNKSALSIYDEWGKKWTITTAKKDHAKCPGLINELIELRKQIDNEMKRVQGEADKYNILVMEKLKETKETMSALPESANKINQIFSTTTSMVDNVDKYQDKIRDIDGYRAKGTAVWTVFAGLLSMAYSFIIVCTLLVQYPDECSFIPIACLLKIGIRIINIIFYILALPMSILTLLLVIIGANTHMICTIIENVNPSNAFWKVIDMKFSSTIENAMERITKGEKMIDIRKTETQLNRITTTEPNNFGTKIGQQSDLNKGTLNDGEKENDGIKRNPINRKMTTEPNNVGTPIGQQSDLNKGTLNDGKKENEIAAKQHCGPGNAVCNEQPRELRKKGTDKKTPPVKVTDLIRKCTDDKTFYYASGATETGTIDAIKSTMKNLTLSLGYVVEKLNPINDSVIMDKLQNTPTDCDKEVHKKVSKEKEQLRQLVENVNELIDAINNDDMKKKMNSLTNELVFKYLERFEIAMNEKILTCKPIKAAFVELKKTLCNCLFCSMLYWAVLVAIWCILGSIMVCYNNII